MYGLVISFTNIKDPEKSKYINYVELMGGICVPHLSPMCTHLVTNAFSVILRDWYDFSAILSGPPDLDYPMSAVSDSPPRRSVTPLAGTAARSPGSWDWRAG